MDEEKNELIESEEAPEQQPAGRPVNMRTHYLIRILVGGYLAYLGWQLLQSFISGAANSKALAIIAGVAFLILGIALVVWSVILLTRDDS